jgi:Fibronectin type III domain
LTASYDRGYVSITNYQLDYQLKDANAWATVVTQTSTSTTHSMTFSSGAYYQYRVRAANTHGWGPYSDSLELQADSVPVQMAVPTSTTVEPFKIKVSWTTLTTDAEIGRDAITYY